MLIPLHDDNPLRHIGRQWVTICLIVINILAFVLVQQAGINFGVSGLNQATIALGLIPAEFLGLSPKGAIDIGTNSFLVPEPLTALTYMFLHGDWMHLLGNMLFLWVFGDNIEDAMGHFKFLVFYLVCGVAAGLFQIYLLPGLEQPVIGASGAVAGLVGAYLMLHPKVYMWALVFQLIPLQVRAIWIIAFWLAVQIIHVLGSEQSGVAWGAHIGGFLAGIMLVVLLKHKDVKLFQ